MKFPQYQQIEIYDETQKGDILNCSRLLEVIFILMMIHGFVINVDAIIQIRPTI